MESGSLGLALAAGLVFVGGMILETRVLLRFRWDGYFWAAFPLGARLVPIPHPPEGEGRTRSVRWEVSSPHVVRFWADPAERVAPTGLHGVVLLAQGRHGVELDVRWAPPWTPLLAAIWLAVLGTARGEGQFTIPIAVAIVLAIGLLYAERARGIAAELRWAFVRGSEPPEDEAG
jgi:hypothetical protein